MSDQSPASQPAVVANATQALAIQELTDQMSGIKKQFKALWIAVGVIGVIVLILASLTVIQRVTAANRIGGFRNGTFNGQQVPGGTGTQQTTPGQ
jgi:beta-lactamase regulating signal transducer with metallopeptidase domain